MGNTLNWIQVRLISANNSKIYYSHQRSTLVFLKLILKIKYTSLHTWIPIRWESASNTNESASSLQRGQIGGDSLFLKSKIINNFKFTYVFNEIRHFGYVQRNVSFLRKLMRDQIID